MGESLNQTALFAGQEVKNMYIETLGNLTFKPVLPNEYYVKAEIFRRNAQPQTVYSSFSRRSYTTNAEYRIILTDEYGQMSTISDKLFCMLYVGRFTERPFSVTKINTYPWYGKSKVLIAKCPASDFLMWAVHIPLVYKGEVYLGYGPVLSVNIPELRHGQGDWIVCSDEENHPNMGDAYVVNGTIFHDRYRIISGDETWKYASMRLPNGQLVYRNTMYF